MKGFLKMLLLVFFLSIMYIYTLAINSIPNNLTLYEGEKIQLRTLLGINIKNKNDLIEANSGKSQTIEASSNSSYKENYNVSLFNKVSVKSVNVDIIPKTKVIPIGNIAGVKLYTNGVLVVGMSEIEGIDNKKHKPYENTGIEEGDTIIKINNNQIDSTEDLIKNVNMSKGNNIKINYIHENQTKECSIKPVETGKSEYKIGLWVRDSAAGVGTVTFYEPSTKTFGALGHGITDIDTGKLINIASGEFITTKILNINKGTNGNPGKIQGTIENQTKIGTISKNTRFGIFGKVDDLSNLKIDTSNEMEVALRDEVKSGKAYILCCLDNKEPQKYEIEIKKIFYNNNYDNKSMQIKVIDKNLIEKTGGIIQGMSGSPIIQNNKFIGAVTHVMISNPQEGYGVFADIMLKKSKEINNN